MSDAIVDTKGGAPSERSGRRTNAETVAEGVARLIELRVYHPGDRLREQDLAERFKVSRGPIREALRILEAKSLVHIEPMRGATVARLSDEEAKDAVEISAVLFGLACQYAAGRLSAADRAALHAKHAGLKAMTAMDVPAKEFFRQTLRLGIVIMRASGSRKLQTMLTEIRVGAPDLYGPLGFHTVDLRQIAVRKWADLIRALESKDAEAAARLGREVHADALDAAVKVLG